MRLLQSAKLAFSMYSVIPMPYTDWNVENMRYVMCFFPLIGCFIGAAVYGWLWLAQLLGIGAVLTAAVAAALPCLLTGGIHLDGFCDTTDALASHAPPQRRLEILKDPHIGAFALIGCSLYLLLNFALWTEYRFTPQTAGIAAAGFVLSRSLSGLSVLSFRSAKSGGLVAAFSDAAKAQCHAVMLIWVWCAAAWMLWLSLAAGGICLAAAVLVFLFYKRTAYRGFGGVTGDLAGWFLQLCELALLAAVVIYGGLAV